MIVKAQNNQRNKMNIRLVSKYYACKIKIAFYLSFNSVVCKNTTNKGT